MLYTKHIIIYFWLQSQMKRKGDHDKANIINDYLVAGVFAVTVINVFAAAFTTTDK